MRPYESVQSATPKVPITVIFKFTIVGSSTGGCSLLCGQIENYAVTDRVYFVEGREHQTV